MNNEMERLEIPRTRGRQRQPLYGHISSTTSIHGLPERASLPLQGLRSLLSRFTSLSREKHISTNKGFFERSNDFKSFTNR